jgi:hypothetical protein
MKNLRMLVLTFSVWGISSLAQIKAQDVDSLIQNFDFDAITVDPLKSLGDYAELENLYRSFKVQDPDRTEAFQLKYQWAHFSMEFRRLLVPALRQKRVSRDTISSLLAERSFILSADQAKTLGIPTVVDVPSGTFEVFPLKGTANSRFKAWAEREDLSEGFTMGPDTVKYRGLELKTGDIIAVDVNTRTFGIAGSLQDELQLTNHAGFLVLMKRGERRIPTVFDIHQAGLRATPLHLFVSQDVVAYAEVVRPRHLGPADRSRIESVMEDIVGGQESFAFDFSAFDLKPRQESGYLCTTFINEIYERSGVSPLNGSTRHDPRVQANLLRMGPIAEEYLSPSDYLDSPETDWIGFFENGRARARTVTFVTSTVLGDLMRNRLISSQKVKAAAATNTQGVIAMRDPGSSLGGLIRNISGIPLEAVPKGDPELIGASVFVDQSIEKAVQFCTEIPTSLCAKYFEGYFGRIDPRRFSMLALMGDEEAKKQILQNLKGLVAVFE